MTTRPETETVITWTAEDDRATVYSLMPRIWKQCLDAGGEEIDLGGGVRGGDKVARTFLVPVEFVKIRKGRVLTGEQLERMRARGRAMSAARMGLTPAQQQSDENDNEGDS